MQLHNRQDRFRVTTTSYAIVLLINFNVIRDVKSSEVIRKEEIWQKMRVLVAAEEGEHLVFYLINSH